MSEKLTDIYKYRPVDVRRKLGMTDRQLGFLFDREKADTRMVDTDTPDTDDPKTVLRIGRQRMFSDKNVAYIKETLLRRKQKQATV